MNQAATLAADITNAPSGSDPSYNWEIQSDAGDWSTFGKNATLSFVAAKWESWTFRVTVSYDNGDSATSDPLTVTWSNSNNRAPVVDTEAEYYARITGSINAPSEVLVSKPFYQVFSDPDGDDLTYTASITSGNSDLVEQFVLRMPDDPRLAFTPTVGLFPRVFLTAGDDAGWKALSPALADPAPVTVTLTATDPGGLSVSVESPFAIHWDSHPEVVSATASGTDIELTFDVDVEDDPAPAAGQFTVNTTNADETTGTIAVSGVSVNGKVVTLALASASESDQTVTVDYEHDKDAPLKRAADGGDHAPSFTGQAARWRRRRRSSTCAWRRPMLSAPRPAPSPRPGIPSPTRPPRTCAGGGAGPTPCRGTAAACPPASPAPTSSSNPTACTT